MAAKKLPESESKSTPEFASDWFRQFLKHLEVDIAENGPQAQAGPTIFECGLIAVQAVRRVLLDSGPDDEQIVGIFGRTASKDLRENLGLQWNAEWNRRRFELIDFDIQGKLSGAEEFELTAITQLMREQVDSESNLQFEGARKLHRYLTEGGNEPKGQEN